MLSITLQFTDLAAAAHALLRMSQPEQFATAVAPVAEPAPAATIAHADRPDVGAPVAQPALPPVPPADPVAAAFGGAVVQAAPLVPATPPAVVPTAQPASTPLSAATAPTAVPGTVERDSTGLPWDARIHASTKTKTKEGVWTAKRNVPDDLRAQVVADLRGLPAPAAAVAPVTAPAAPLPPAAPAAPLPPAAPPAAPVAAPVAAPAAPQAKTFAEYMAEVGGAFSARPVDAHTAMAAALAPHGMQHVGQLAGKPELIPAVDAEFRRLLG